MSGVSIFRGVRNHQVSTIRGVRSNRNGGFFFFDDFKLGIMMLHNPGWASTRLALAFACITTVICDETGPHQSPFRFWA
jgi:hypothetical protein